MAQKVTVKHPASGLVKTGKHGYSWTYLFFGWWVPLIRGELGVAALHLMFTFFTLGLWQIVVSFMYNKQYMSRLLQSGWVLADTPEAMRAARAAIGMSEPEVLEKTA